MAILRNAHSIEITALVDLQSWVMYMRTRPWLDFGCVCIWMGTAAEYASGNGFLLCVFPSFPSSPLNGIGKCFGVDCI